MVLLLLGEGLLEELEVLVGRHAVRLSLLGLDSLLGAANGGVLGVERRHVGGEVRGELGGLGGLRGGELADVLLGVGLGL